MNRSIATFIRCYYVTALAGVLSVQALEHNQMIWRPWCGERPLKNSLRDTKQLIPIVTEAFDKGGEFEEAQDTYTFVEQAHQYQAGCQTILKTRDRLIIEGQMPDQAHPLEPYAPLTFGGKLLNGGEELELLCSSKSGTHLAALKPLICGYTVLLINTSKPATYELEVPMLVSPLEAGFSADDQTLMVRYLLTEYQWDLDNL